MTKISIIGTGNVAFHLCKVFSEQNFEIEIYGRNQANVKQFEEEFNIKSLTDLTHIDPNSFVFLCVNDDQIIHLLNELDIHLSVVYTAGTVSLNTLPPRKNLGVFYPLQTFSKVREIDFFQVPILIESNNEYFTQILFNIAWKISRKVEFADSDKRKNLHIAAVFINNFTNHLFYLAKNHLDENQIDWKLLQPLIQETFHKLQEKSPFEAQTGPAKRKDFQTIQSHEKMLQGKTLEIYKLLTKSIMDTYKNQ